MENSIKTYIRMKISMIERDFRLRLSDVQKEHFYSLKSEIAVDNYARVLLRDYFNNMK